MIDWQVYNNNGSQIAGESVSKAEALAHGVPHAASHIWIWRKNAAGITELLFQVSAKSYRLGKHDITAAGHVDVGESEVQAAVREAKEEVGLDIGGSALYLAGVEHYIRKDEIDKNEFRFIYVLPWDENMTFSFDDGEVAGMEWVEVQ